MVFVVSAFAMLVAQVRAAGVHIQVMRWTTDMRIAEALAIFDQACMLQSNVSKFSLAGCQHAERNAHAPTPMRWPTCTALECHVICPELRPSSSAMVTHAHPQLVLCSCENELHCKLDHNEMTYRVNGQSIH